MQLITPFDFVDMFPARRRMVVVGNASTLKGSGLGEWIDGHNIVVRFNECAINGFESDVGQRTDILVTNPFVEDRQRPIADGRGCGVVLAITPLTRRGSNLEFSDWVGDSKVLFTHRLSVENGLSGARSLTTGTCGLYFLAMLLRPRLLSCTGFTMFEGEDHHYWRQGPISERGKRAHDPAREAKVFAALLTRVFPDRLKCRIVVTSEVAWMCRKAGPASKPSFQVKPLQDSRWDALD